MHEEIANSESSLGRELFILGYVYGQKSMFYTTLSTSRILGLIRS